MNALTPGYFKAMHVPVLAGRDFQISDQREFKLGRQHDSGPRVGDRQPALRRALLQDRQRRRQAHRLGRRPEDEAEHRDRRRRREPAVRRAARGRSAGRCSSRAPATAASVYYVRSSIGSTTLYGPAPQRSPRRIDNAMPIFGMKTLESQLDETLLTDRLVALLAAGFGLLGGAARLDRSLRGDGVRRRPAPQGAGHPAGPRRDARRRDLDGDAGSADAARASGSASAIPAALPGCCGSVSSEADIQLYGVEPTTRWSAALTALLLIAVTVLAGLIPAQRASRINPITALRYE